VSGQLDVLATLPPGEKPPVPIGLGAGWAQEPVWTLLNRDQALLPPAGRRIPDFQPVALRYTDRAIFLIIVIVFRRQWLIVVGADSKLYRLYHVCLSRDLVSHTE
jgi:hypothetical protein